jgi:hypothetical protein
MGLDSLGKSFDSALQAQRVFGTQSWITGSDGRVVSLPGSHGTVERRP